MSAVPSSSESVAAKTSEAPAEPREAEAGATLGRVERWAPLAAGVLLAIPTLLAHNLPMSDLPMHEGVVGILRHFGDPEYFPPGLYRLNLGHPNQLFHLSAFLLSFAFGVTWGCKIVVAVAQVAIMQTGARLADYLGRSRWAALVLAPLALGFTYYWGLVANLLGFAAFFGALPLLDRVAARPTARSTGAACAVLVLVFFAHESVFSMAVGFSGLVALAHPLDRIRTPIRLVPGAFGVVFGVAHFFYSLQFFTGSKVEAPAYFPSLRDKLVALPSDLFGSHDAETRWMLFALGSAAIIALLIGRLRSREASPSRRGKGLARAQQLLLHYRFEVTAAIFVVAFVVVPLSWNTATLLHERFIGPAWALLALTAAPRSSPPRIAKLLALVLPLGIVLLSWPQFVDSDRSARDLEKLAERIPKGSAVAVAVLDRPPVATRVYSGGMAPARVVAQRGGRVALSLTPSPLSPVQFRPEYSWDEVDRRMLVSTSRALKPGFDLDRFEWVIAQSRDVVIRNLIPAAFKPDAELVAAEGEWMLLRSTHPQSPLKSPNVVPKPGERVILDRMYELLALRNEVLRGHVPADVLDPPPWTRGGALTPIVDGGVPGQ